MPTRDVTLRPAQPGRHDVENAAELAAVKRIGFQVEGRLRRAQWRGARWHDLVLLSLLRAEWQDGRATPSSPR